MCICDLSTCTSAMSDIGSILIGSHPAIEIIDLIDEYWPKEGKQVNEVSAVHWWHSGWRAHLHSQLSRVLYPSVCAQRAEWLIRLSQANERAGKIRIFTREALLCYSPSPLPGTRWMFGNALLNGLQSSFSLKISGTLSLDSFFNIVLLVCYFQYFILLWQTIHLLLKSYDKQFA